MVPPLELIILVISFFAFKNVTDTRAKEQHIVISLSLALDIIAVPIANHARDLLSASSCSNVPFITNVAWILAGSATVLSLYNLYVAIKNKGQIKQVVWAALFILSSLIAAFSIWLLSSFCLTF